jgi:hypothetical protein
LTSHKEREKFYVCPGRSETSGNPHALCSTSLELRLTLQDSANSWLSPGRFNAQYQKIAAEALLQDILHAIPRGPAAQRLLEAARVAVGPCEYMPSAGDFIVNGITTGVPNEAPTALGLPFCLARLAGPASTVGALVTALLAQMKDSMSPLRSGLISAHLHHASTVVISHSTTTAEPDALSGGYAWLGWGAAAAVVAAVLLLLRSRRRLRSSAETSVGARQHV